MYTLGDWTNTLDMWTEDWEDDREKKNKREQKQQRTELVVQVSSWFRNARSGMRFCIWSDNNIDNEDRADGYHTEFIESKSE